MFLFLPAGSGVSSFVLGVQKLWWILSKGYERITILVTGVANGGSIWSWSSYSWHHRDYCTPQGAPHCWALKMVIYPINTHYYHYTRCIWGGFLRVPSQGYHHFPYAGRKQIIQTYQVYCLSSGAKYDNCTPAWMYDVIYVWIYNSNKNNVWTDMPCPGRSVSPTLPLPNQTLNMDYWIIYTQKTIFKKEQ